jgi:DNA-binding transcriptional regulator YiaG
VISAIAKHHRRSVTEPQQEADQLLWADEARKTARQCGIVHLERDPVPNWPVIIRELRIVHGLSFRTIADALCICHATVQKWENGSPPNYADGAALIKFYRLYAGAYQKP